MAQRRVFIPQIPMRYDRVTSSRVPSLDLNPAADYGTCIAMASPDASGNAAIRQVRDAASHIKPNDLILGVGDVALIATALIYANQKNGSAQLLRWDKIRKHYDIQEITL